MELKWEPCSLEAWEPCTFKSHLYGIEILYRHVVNVDLVV